MKKFRYMLFTALVTITFASIADVKEEKDKVEPLKYCAFGICITLRGGGDGWQPPVGD